MRRSRFAFLSFAAAAAACAPAPVIAQCRLCSTPTTTVQEDPAAQDVQLEIETGLNFDRLITLGPGEGFAELRPNGAKSAIGAVTEIGPRAMVGTVVVRGQSGRAVRVDLPTRIELFALGGGRVTLDQLETDLPSMPRLELRRKSDVPLRWPVARHRRYGRRLSRRPSDYRRVSRLLNRSRVRRTNSCPIRTDP